MAENSIFFLIEKVIGEQIPKPLVYILNESGFNTKIALKNIIPEKTITQVENFFNKNYDKLKKGLLGSIYENVLPFNIVPGHRIFIESLPQYMDLVKIENQPQLLKEIPNDFSLILRLLIETAEKNSKRDPKSRRFNENIQHFATYVYLMCGRSCYETLSANLPIPQANTICKYALFAN